MEKTKSMIKSGAHPKTVPMNKSSTTINNKSKSKNYEKEIDSLLQKIENLEKQKYNAQKPSKTPTKKELFSNKNSDIAKKLRKFMDTAPKEEPARPFMYQSTQKQQPPEMEQMENQQPQQWDSMLPPPPPPLPPPMPFMPAASPFMHQPIQDMDQQQPPHHQIQNEINPNSMMMMNGDEYNKQQQMAQSYPPLPPPTQPEQGYPSYIPPPLPPNVYPPSYPPPPPPPQPSQNYPEQPTYYPSQQQQSQMQASNQIQTYVHPAHYQQQQSPQPNGNYQYPVQQQSSEPIHDDMMMETTTKKPSKLSQISRRFQLSRIFTSVMPKSKKAKKRPLPPPPQEYQYEDSRQHHMMPQDDNVSEMVGGPPPPPPPGPMTQDGQPPYDQMMTQESRYKTAVDRGYRGGGYAPMEAAGMQVRFGGGPMGGGSQVKVNPMAILKTLAFPMMKKPALNLNGKVVLGIVLENGAHGPYRKPKTVFQHYSTGRIKR